MAIARIGEINLAYAVEGERSKDWVVLIGGYASGHRQSWKSYLPALTANCRVLSFDNRGIGESDAPDYPYTTQMMADDTVGLMDHLGIERAHVLGRSLGGSIAQWVAIKHPHRVRSLAMTSTFARAEPRSVRIVDGWMELARHGGFPAFFRFLMTYFYTAEFYQQHPDIIARGEAALLDTRRTLAGFLHTGAAVNSHDAWSRIAEIAAPTLVLCGAEDVVTPARHSEDIGHHIPNSIVHIIPRTAHGFLTEQPESFKLITEFFKGASVD